jgi:phospholipid-transporting ATPase
MANGVFHSLILFMLPAFAAAYESSSIGGNGRSLGIYESGIVVYTCVILVVSLKLALESSYWTWINHLVVWGSIFIGFFLFQLVYSFFGFFVSMGWDVTFSFYIVASLPTYWFCILLVPFAALSHDVTWKYIKRTYAPEFYHIVQEIERIERRDDTTDHLEHFDDTHSAQPQTEKLLQQMDAAADEVFSESSSSDDDADDDVDDADRLAVCCCRSVVVVVVVGL